MKLRVIGEWDVRWRRWLYMEIGEGKMCMGKRKGRRRKEKEGGGEGGE